MFVVSSSRHVQLILSHFLVHSSRNPRNIMQRSFRTNSFSRSNDEVHAQHTRLFMDMQSEFHASQWIRRSEMIRRAAS